MDIIKEIHATTWSTPFSTETQLTAIHALENGNILLMPQLPFNLLTEEQELLSPIYTHPKAKQISFNCATDLVRGTRCSAVQYDIYKKMLIRFSLATKNLIHALFPTYIPHLKIGRSSFRAIEIAGRTTSYKKDDTRLHVDAFPSAPIHGQRILRVFSNINPNGVNRVWRAGESFMEVAKRFLPQVKKRLPGSAALLKAFKITKSYRTEYDHIMLEIHNKMKADLFYQKNVQQTEVNFAPGNSWIVQTDHVSHAAMSGQHVLEQTFYLPVNAMMNPELAPLRVLEQLTGRTLV